MTPNGIEVFPPFPSLLSSRCSKVCMHAGSHETFAPALEAAWAALLAAIRVQAFSGLSQSCIADLILQPLAAALRHKSSAVHDMAEEFWSSSGIQDALKGYDVGLVEVALAMAGSQRSQKGGVEGALQQQVGRSNLQLLVGACLVSV